MSPIDREKVSKRLQAIRRHAGKTQAEMGAITRKGLYYGNIERGSDDFSELVVIQIAEALDIDPDWLLHGTGNSPFPEKLEGKIPDSIKPTMEDKKESKPKRVPIPEFPIDHKPVVAMSEEKAEQVTSSTNPCLDPIVTITYESLKFVAVHKSGARIYITIIPPVETLTVNYENVDLALSLKSIEELIDLLHCAKSKVEEILS